MRVHLLYAIVTFQILIFQFIAVRFIRAIPDHFLGKENLPGHVADAMRRLKRSLTSTNYGIGAALWAAMTVGIYILPFRHFAADRLIAAVVSVFSSVVLVWAYLGAVSEGRAIADMIPDTGRRVASLERRTLGKYYNTAWELVPFAILAATAAFTFWALPQLYAPYPIHYDSSGIPDRWGEGAARFLSILVIQAVIAVGLLLLTFGLVRARGCLSPRAPLVSASPSWAEQLRETARKRELRYFMVAKILVSLQFGLILFVKLRMALGNIPSDWVAAAPWATTGLLLIVFAAYAFQAARVRKEEEGP
jgi:uncharacterized membrane protein